MIDNETRRRHAKCGLTTAQKNLIIVLLKRAGLLDAKLRGGHTSPSWRQLFEIAGTKEPEDALRWPSADEWVDGLGMVQGHDVIRHLKKITGETRFQ